MSNQDLLSGNAYFLMGTPFDLLAKHRSLDQGRIISTYILSSTPLALLRKIKIKRCPAPGIKWAWSLKILRARTQLLPSTPLCQILHTPLIDPYFTSRNTLYSYLNLLVTFFVETVSIMIADNSQLAIARA